MVRRFVVPIDSLPYPHPLLKCRFGPRHEELVDAEEDTNDGRRRAWEELIEEIGPDRITECAYDRTDWLTVAALACEHVRGGALSSDGLEAKAASAGITRDCELEGLHAFFGAWAITLDGVDRLKNGQHRSCAMRVAGVSECPIEEDF